MVFNVDELTYRLIQMFISILVFIILFFPSRRIFNKIKKHENKFTDNRVFNPTEYLPDEEIITLRQVFYLIILFLFFILFLYNLVFTGQSGFFSTVEIILMLYVAINLDYSSWKNKLFFFILIPYEAISCILFNTVTLSFFDSVHLIVLLYFMFVYYKKFREYTENNGLGITILLLFSIIFLSFNITMLAEGVNPIDSMVMVSNAFTSNGYAVLGGSTVGKVNSLLLVWSGYIISGAGTATLTAAILMRQFKKQFKDIELIKKQNEELMEVIDKNNKELRELIEKNNE